VENSSTVQGYTGTRRPHFVVLDGLRGVAAVCVVIFHFSEMVVWDYSKLWIGHGYLAVDFFFCLSGFVLGYAYDDRIAKIGLASFFRARLIRLHPLVILGSVLGVIAFYANPLGITPGYGPAKVALIFAASVFLIPWGAMTQRDRNLFSFNAPSWSLFWEYVANIVFAVVLCRIRRSWLLAFTVAAAVLLCWTGYHAGNLSGGWSTGTFWDGGARVAFSFSAGLLVYRAGWRPRTRLGFASLSVLLVLALLSPYAHGAWVREAAAIILFFPLLVGLGAGAVVTPRVERLCKFSGDLSYPLYMTHYSVIWIWGDYAAKNHLASTRLWTEIGLGTCVMVGFAWAVYKLYDEPLRRALTARFGRPRQEELLGN
jgi:peptidoglycan/LPS O-acetylase OafA/YrhL